MSVRPQWIRPDNYEARLEEYSRLLASAQSDVLALREALAKYKWAAAPEQHGGTSAYPYEEICELLSRHTSTDALRALLRSAVVEAGREGYETTAQIDACVSRLLGEDKP